MNFVVKRVVTAVTNRNASVNAREGDYDLPPSVFGKGRVGKNTFLKSDKQMRIENKKHLAIRFIRLLARKCH